MTAPEQSGFTTHVSRGFLVCLLVATVVGGALRLYALNSASFWEDELYTLRTFGELGSMHRSKIVGYLPSAFGLWAHGVHEADVPPGQPDAWRRAGATEFAARIGPALIGILSIAWLGWAARHVLGTRAAGILALLLAVAPWHIYWSQAARFYSLQFLFYGLALLWYFKATRDRSRPAFVYAMIFAVLAFLSQPPALVILAVFAADWLYAWVRHDSVRLGLFGWTAAIVALGICLATLAFDVSARPSEWTQFAGDTYQTPLKLTLGTVFMVTPVVVLMGTLSGVYLFRSQRRLAFYLLAAAIVPLVILAIMSVGSYVALRYTFICLLPWLALAALGIDEVYRVLQTARGRLGVVLGVAPLALVLTPMLMMDYMYFTTGYRLHPRWREAFEYVAEHRRPGDLVMAEPIVGRYYLGDADVRPLPKGPQALAELGRTVWLVSEAGDATFANRRGWLDENVPIKTLFDAQMYRWMASVRVYRYEPPATAAAAPPELASER